MYPRIPAVTVVAAALAISTAALAEPSAPWRPPVDDDVNSATVELLRVADRVADRFADITVDHSGRIVGRPPGGRDVLINNPAACASPDVGAMPPVL